MSDHGDDGKDSKGSGPPDKNNNVIDLDKVRRERHPPDKIEVLQKQLNQQQKKMILGFSVLSLVVVGLLVNQLGLIGVEQTFLVEHGHNEDSGDRTPASTWKTARIDSNLVIEVLDAEVIHSQDREPTSLDRFAAGELGGQYHLRTRNGRVVELKHISPQDDLSKVGRKIIGERQKFLNGNRALFGFDRAIFNATYQEGEGGLRVEKYRLYDASGSPMGTAEIFLDQSNGLQSLFIAEN